MLTRTGAVAAILAAGFSAATAQAATEVEWWHAMGGQLGEKVDAIAAQFNASQTEYVVKPVYKGNYTETMTAAIAAFRAQQHPQIVQVFEVGTATMMSAEGAVYPVHELMADTGEPFDPNAYLDAVKSYYTTPDGKMLSLAFNSSTPVLWYNKDMFREAGLDPEQPPKTWEALAQASRTLIETGAAQCGFTSGWQSWILLENFSAWHDVPFATRQNGFAGFDTELGFASPAHVRHIKAIADWQSEKVFRYGGRRGDPNPLFLNGECAMLLNSSAYFGGFRDAAQFEVGQGMMPYWESEADGPQNSIIGGATLWVLAGHDADTYRGVARFFSYLSSPEVQADWHMSTGYVPITYAAYERARELGHYRKNPGTDTAIRQLTLNTPTPNSKGLRLGNFVQIRDILNEELEAVWAGEKAADEALTAAVTRGNALLRKFERATH